MSSSPARSQRSLGALLTAWLRGERAGRHSEPGAVWACFERLHAYEPKVLSWVLPVPGLDRRYLMLAFHTDFLRRYTGHEVVLFGEREFLYYWLPGARQNATGHVSPGHHALLLHTRTEGLRLRLELEKSEDGALSVGEVAVTPEVALPERTVLSPRSLDYGRYFLPELEAVVMMWLTWHAQALHMGVLRPSPGEAERLAELVEPCRALNPAIRARAGELLTRLPRATRSHPVLEGVRVQTKNFPST